MPLSGADVYVISPQDADGNDLFDVTASPETTNANEEAEFTVSANANSVAGDHTFIISTTADETGKIGEFTVSYDEAGEIAL
ncbi:MAG: hypothetical protein H0Z34_11055 [Brevibacillus sp.]|nr:hypothetical protein [Brevibacillus sp.]